MILKGEKEGWIVGHTEISRDSLQIPVVEVILHALFLLLIPQTAEGYMIRIVREPAQDPGVFVVVPKFLPQRQ